MKKQSRILLAVVMIMGLALGMVQGASAKPLAGSLPPYKNPASARFDLSGSLKSTGSAPGSNLNMQLGGSGAMSGNNLQEDIMLTFDPSTLGLGSTGGTLPQGPVTITASVIILDGKIYTRTTGANSLLGSLGAGTGVDEDTWTEVDAGSSGGLTSGLTSGSMTGLDPRYADAYTTTQVGKESVNGVPTTKYRTDVDYTKLLGALGIPGDTQTGAESLGNLSLVSYTWVGDSDMYVHKQSLVESLSGGSGSTASNVSIEITVVYKDFDVPVTITAPTKVQKLDVSNLGGSASLGGLLGGMAGGVTTGVEMGMPTMGHAGGTMAGMPRTGGAIAGELPLGTLLLSALAGLLLLSGLAARRYSRN